jgi:putative ABC transport system substrate-binding protein
MQTFARTMFRCFRPDGRVFFSLPLAILLLTIPFGLLVAPRTAEAQQPAKVWRIGIFHVGLDHVPPSIGGLREGLKALGYEDGKNIRLDWRNLLDEDAARVTAREWVRDRVDLIVAVEPQTVRAAKAATSQVPIVFLHIDDPVADGFVQSLAHPGGNLTGFAGRPVLHDKRLEIFKELVPGLRRLLVLRDPTDPATERLWAVVQEAAAALKLQLVEREVTTPADIERVFGALKPGDVDGVFLVSPRLDTNFPSLILRLASERHLPLPGPLKQWVAQGALFYYGVNYPAIGEAAAQYVVKILKGAKPADLPVEFPKRFELIVNLKAAQALGLTIPPVVLLQADEVMR